MDIVQSSRAYFAMPSPTPEEKITLQASNTVYTYHCLCSHLLLATTTPLPALPTRQNSHDKAHIMPLPPASNKSDNSHYGLLLSVRQERTAETMTSNDGFEKRYLQRCGRCNLTVGYQLDWQQFAGDRTGRRDDVVFLIPGGFMTTSEMVHYNKSTGASATRGGGVTGMSSATAVAA